MDNQPTYTGRMRNDCPGDCCKLEGPASAGPTYTTRIKRAIEIRNQFMSAMHWAIKEGMLDIDAG